MSSACAPAVDALKAAFERRDFSLAAEHLADDVVLRSPVLETPWSTRPVLERLGPAMVRVFDDLVVTDTAVTCRRAFVAFVARRADTAVEGVQVVDVGADGRVTDLAILIRPLPALIAVAEAMRSAVDPDPLRGHTP